MGDSARTVYDRYATDYIPRNFLIDKQGKVILATVGYDDEEFDALIRTIAKDTRKLNLKRHGYTNDSQRCHRAACKRPSTTSKRNC